MKRRRSTRSPLGAMLQRAFFQTLYPEKTPPLDASRRRFLRNSAVLAAATSVAGCGVLSPKNLSKKYRIAVIGAGMAGLSAAWQLHKKGIWADVFEAAPRTGGRMFTVRDAMASGLTTDFGGEFVDSIHEDIRDLCREFDLDFWDTHADSEKSLQEMAFFLQPEGKEKMPAKFFSETEAIAALQPFAARLQADIDRIPEPLTRLNAASVQDLDNLSVRDYLKQIGCNGWLSRLLEVAVMTEYGMEASEQSAINLLFTMAVPKPGDTSFDVFAESDERYKIKGGSQALTNRMTERLQEQIKLGHKLTKISRKGTSYTLSFANGTSYEANFVIMTLPFTMLRELDFSEAGFSADKSMAIRELGYGYSSKLMLGLKKRVWREQGYSGNIYTDNWVQAGWDNARMQPGDAGGYTIFLGGNKAQYMDTGISPTEQISHYMKHLDEVFPGIAAAHNTQVARMHWPTYPFSQAGYLWLGKPNRRACLFCR
jgi:monoamine oxidase